MAKSMTGYGRSRCLTDGRDVTFEIKSVNNRFLDINIKMSRLYSPFEDRIKQLIRQHTTRGKVDAYLSVDNIEGEQTELAINNQFVSEYVEKLKTLKETYGLSGEIELGLVATRQETFISKKPNEDMEAIWQTVSPVIVEALEAYNRMRCTEGDKLKADILSRVKRLKEIRNSIFDVAPVIVAEANARMQERVKELLGSATVDESRLLTECAIYADKGDITEELVRLESHFSQLEKLMEKNDNVGKTVDFLLQETNREINTIGSKSNSVDIANLVIEAKSELEKIREQIQNIE